MVSLPPDLSRLGDELTAATGRALDERRRRRRRLAHIGASAVSGLLALAVLTPAGLGPEPGLASRLTTLPLAEEALHTVVARPPDRRPASDGRPVLLARETTIGTAFVARPPARRPVIPPRRDA